MGNQVVIFGTGDVGRLAHFYFTHDSDYEVAAFSADGDFIEEKEFLGLPLLAFEEVTSLYPPDQYKMFVALSYKNVNQVRAQKYYEAKEKGYELVSYICSTATTWPDLKIGDNCFIFEDQTIQPYVEIGNNVVMWSGNHIGHDSIIGDHCFLTSHVVVSGYVTVKEKCFLGVNCTIRDGITIGEECVIGAGALILKDAQPKGVYMTTPAKLAFKDSSKLGYFTNTTLKNS